MYKGSDESRRFEGGYKEKFRLTNIESVLFFEELDSVTRRTGTGPPDAQCFTPVDEECCQLSDTAVGEELHQRYYSEYRLPA